MSLLTSMQAVARNIGIQSPNSVVGNNDPDSVKLLQFANETGEELARRVDWARMRKSQLVLGSGFAALFNLPPDYARMIEGWGVTHDGNPVRGGLTGDEWNSLPPVMGAPRYYQVIGKQIGFYPFPPEGGQLTVNFIGTGWTSLGNAAFTKDDETTMFPERLLEMGTVWRFKRHISADYSDYLAEYEAALADLARFDGMVRLP